MPFCGGACKSNLDTMAPPRRFSPRTWMETARVFTIVVSKLEFCWIGVCISLLICLRWHLGKYGAHFSANWNLYRRMWELFAS